MLHIEKAVIVEGKYDKIRLSNIIDAQIITTGGFDIFNDKPKRKLLKMLADKKGIILLTDSDRAGFKIRGHISGFLPKENVVHLFVPQREGKESRKAEPSKDGFLGVEGIDDRTLEKLFEPYSNENARQNNCISKTEMYEIGLFGRENSSALRNALCKKLDLPLNMSSNALCSALNMMFTKEEIEKALCEIE